MSISKQSINALIFQLGWWTVVIGASKSLSWELGLATSLALLLHFSLVEKPRTIPVLFSVISLGCLMDYSLARFGVMIFSEAPITIPLWLIYLWILFSTTYSPALSWLKNRPFASALLGAVFGPLSYFAGMKFSLIEFPKGEISFVILALAWGIFMPVSIYLYWKIRGRLAL